MLIISLLFIAGNGFFDNILNVWMKRSINKNLTSTVVNKFIKLEYDSVLSSGVK